MKSAEEIFKNLLKQDMIFTKGFLNPKFFMTAGREGKLYDILNFSPFQVVQTFYKS